MTPNPGEEGSFNIDIELQVDHPDCPDDAPSITNVDLTLAPPLAGEGEDGLETCAGIAIWINTEDPIDTDYTATLTIDFDDGSQCVVVETFTYPAP